MKRTIVYMLKGKTVSKQDGPNDVEIAVPLSVQRPGSFNKEITIPGPHGIAQFRVKIAYTQ